MTPPLACTVRDCGLVLERRGRTYECARRHSYDIARSGYVNLLQPNDRRSLKAGDSADAIGARARLLALGVGRSVINAVVERVSTMLSDADVIADLGSGSGELLADVTQRRGVTAIGIDLSPAAADHAARKYRDITWVVANADRRLPLLDRTVDAIVSVHGRRNPAECARVVTPTGHLVIVVPASDDLIELRQHVEGRAVEQQRGVALEQEHASQFTVVDRCEVRERHELAPDSLRDLLRGTYRGERKRAAERIESLRQLEVTLASLLFVLKRRDPD